ncbi:TULIP family P47-like protein [Klebsiella variicola]
MDIYNWDMVCAVSCAELNKKLKTASRDTFGEFSWSDSEGNEISGEFKGWEIVPGGDAQRICIITPLSAGELTVPALGKNKIPVASLCPELQVELAFVHAGNDDNTTHLGFNLAQVSKKDDPVTAGHGSVVVLDADVNHLFSDADVLIPELYCDMMAEMLVAMKDKLAFIFAEIMDIPAVSDISWMKPHLLQYAYNEKISGCLGSMAVLAILAENPSPPSPGELQLVFDSDLIREDGSMGLMLSQRLFMKYVVLPGLPGAFAGSDTSQFLLMDNNVITNNGSISLNRLDGYTPYFNSLDVRVLDDRIVLSNASGRCDVVSYSSYVSFDLSAIYTPTLAAAGGRYSVGLESVNRPVFYCEAHDTAALVFWVFGGWVVDALVKGIKSQMDSLLFESGYRMNFDMLPVTFSTDARYSNCGLAGNFYMQD